MDNNQCCDKISNGEENEGDINCPEEVGTALFLHLFYVSLTRSLHYKLRGEIGKKKFFFLIGWRLLIFGRILLKFFVLV